MCIRDSLYDLRETSYRKRANELAGHGVAVWDVLQACTRSSSLDSDIDNDSIITNDFREFFHAHAEIRSIFFNGAKAESVYLKQVIPGLPSVPAAFSHCRLPSTSPAHAGMNFEQKLKAWQALKA